MSSKKQLRTRSNRFHVSRSTTDGAIFSFLSDLNCPRSLTCWMLYKYKEHTQLVNLDVNPNSYTCKYKFRDDYAATNFLQKFPHLSIDVDKKSAAMEKFWKFEELCRRTNHRLRHPSSDGKHTALNASLHTQLIRKVADVLGDFSADEFVDGLAWGPGVSTLIKGDKTSGSHKFQFETGITKNLYPWFSKLKLAEQVHPDWGVLMTASDGTYSLQTQWGNTICTVPKNSKTDRVIAIEPGINIFCQKSAGSMIRNRLLRQGINLRDQNINRLLCRDAVANNLATVDFSSASDSISRVLVQSILPEKWLNLLDKLRSPCMIDSNGNPYPWEKYSSMGNGFTFELESLIFFCAACVVMSHLSLEGRPSVYGDDVILPVEAFELYASFCDYLGFIVNTQKSFYSGLFRESCGVHYYDGLDVQPIFLKERIFNVQGVYKLANSIRLLAHRRNNYYGCDSRMRRTVRYLRLRVSKHLRFVVPLSNSTAGFIGNLDEACPDIIRGKSGWEGFTYPGLLTKARTYEEYHLGYLVDKIWGSKRESTRIHPSINLDERPEIKSKPNETAFRGRVSYSVSRNFFSNSWYNFGGWF